MFNLPAHDLAQLAAQLKRHEGLRLEAYNDTEGILTIGYGHNCRTWPVRGVGNVGDRITQAEADLLFEQDLALAIDSAVANALPVPDAPARKAVLINMVFNMGAGRVLGFKRMLAAIKAGDYATAAAEMLDSKWAVQVGRRSRELATQMQTGQWSA